MEATQIANTTPDAPKQKSKRRFKKLTADEITSFPGAVAPPEKKVEQATAYFIFFNLPVTAPLGTPSEVAQGHDFSYQLDTHAKAKDVGGVTSVGIADGHFEVVLKIATTGEQTSHGAPASNAFTQLKDYLSLAPQLNQGPAGKPATWKAKVNGTTILEGRY